MKYSINLIGLVSLLLVFSTYSQNSEMESHEGLARKQGRERISEIYRNQKSNLSVNQGNYDVQSYEINIEIFPESKMITGEVVIHCSSLENGLTDVNINLYDNMAIDSIKQNTTHLNYSRLNNIISIQINDSANYGDLFSIRIYYNGNPAVGDSVRGWRWGYQKGTNIPVVYSYSLPYGASTWWPCKDDLSNKADSVFINITVPQELVAVSNGTLQNVTTMGNKATYRWKTNYQLAAHLVSVAVSRYSVLNQSVVIAPADTVSLQYYVYPGLASLAQVDFSHIPEMVSFFSSLFGVYPFSKEKYGVVIAPFWGALENQTIITYGDVFIDNAYLYDYILAHELAHQWFGDCITIKRWGHIWLSEGFATYAQALWKEHCNGYEAYLQQMQGFLATDFNGMVFVNDTLNIDSLLSPTVYFKGAWVLHMLRKVMGEGLFFNSLYSYANNADFMYKTAATEDFQSVCETELGMSLGWFFSQWIYRAGRPHYKCFWETTGDGPYLTSLRIEQADSLPYIMPIDIKLNNQVVDTVFTIWDSLQTQEYNFTTLFKPTNLTIDPEGWILKKVETYPTYIRTKKEDLALDRFSLVQNYPNPFNPVTTIRYSIPSNDKGKLSNVKLVVFDVLGRVIAELVNESKEPGTYDVKWDATGFSSGVYFYHLSTGDFFETKKMVYLK